MQEGINAKGSYDTPWNRHESLSFRGAKTKIPQLHWPDCPRQGYSSRNRCRPSHRSFVENCRGGATNESGLFREANQTPDRRQTCGICWSRGYPGQERTVGKRDGDAVPYSMGRAIWLGDDRSDGMRNASIGHTWRFSARSCLQWSIRLHL